MSEKLKRFKKEADSLKEDLRNDDIDFMDRMKLLFQILDIVLPFFQPIETLHKQNLFHNYKYREVAMQYIGIVSGALKAKGIKKLFKDSLLGSAKTNGVDSSLGMDIEMKSMKIRNETYMDIRKANVGMVDKCYNKNGDEMYATCGLLAGLFDDASSLPKLMMYSPKEEFSNSIQETVAEGASDYLKKTDNMTKKGHDAVSITGNDVLSSPQGVVCYIDEEYAKDFNFKNILSDTQIQKIERVFKGQLFLVKGKTCQMPLVSEFDTPETWTIENWAWYLSEYKNEELDSAKVG